MTDQDLRTRPRGPRRHLVRGPLVVGALLVGAAIVWTMVGDALGFAPFLLTLIGGWCLGFAFVNASMQTVPVRAGAVVHIAVAVLLGASMVVVLEFGGELLATLPAPVRSAIVAVQMAAIPAAGWIWLGLIGRVTDLIGRRDAAKRPTPTTPEWEREEDGDGTSVRFPAIDLRLRALRRAIVAIVLVVGGFAAAVLIALDDLVMRVGARIAVIVLGLVLGLPVYLLLLSVVRRRTEQVIVAFGNDELRVTVGGALHVIRYRELVFLHWGVRGDYARIEARGAGVDLSLFAGLAKPPPGRTSELPPLPRRVFRRLELAGLSVERRRRGEVVVFRRAGAEVTRPGTPVP